MKLSTFGKFWWILAPVLAGVGIGCSRFSGAAGNLKLVDISAPPTASAMSVSFICDGQFSGNSMHSVPLQLKISLGRANAREWDISLEAPRVKGGSTLENLGFYFEGFTGPGNSQFIAENKSDSLRWYISNVTKERDGSRHGWKLLTLDAATGAVMYVRKSGDENSSNPDLDDSFTGDCHEDPNDKPRPLPAKTQAELQEEYFNREKKQVEANLQEEALRNPRLASVLNLPFRQASYCQAQKGVLVNQARVPFSESQWQDVVNERVSIALKIGCLAR